MLKKKYLVISLQWWLVISDNSEMKLQISLQLTPNMLQQQQQQQQQRQYNHLYQYYLDIHSDRQCKQHYLRKLHCLLPNVRRVLPAARRG
jgi:hypothetical protein